MARLIDLTNMNFGDWKVVSRAQNNSRGQAMWNCVCKCGTERVVAGGHLRGGRSTGCGCVRMEKMRATRVKNEVGKIYGRLTVLEEDKDPPRKDRHGVYWKCKCECGNIVSVFGDYLRNGDTNSCGCLVSKGEALIAKMLIENNIEFKTQQTFPDLKGENGYALRFDFGVYKDGELSHLIEFDGIQHFKYTTCSTAWNTKENLEVVQRRDALKNEYCQRKNIRLIRIKYNQKFTIKDLI